MKEITYLKINEDTANNYKTHIENAITQSEKYGNIQNLELLMKDRRIGKIP